MTTKHLKLSGEQLDKIFDHVSTTGAPLLRRRRRSDIGLIDAWPEDDGSYSLVDAQLNDFLNSCEGWEEFAQYCEVDLWRIVEILKERDYPWGLPSIEDDHWPAIDAFEMASYLGSRVNISIVDRLRILIPTDIAWDKTTKYPTIPKSVEVAIEWLSGNGVVNLHGETWEMRGGRPERLSVVPSAVSLSCLQHALDKVQAKIQVQVASR